MKFELSSCQGIHAPENSISIFLLLFVLGLTRGEELVLWYKDSGCWLDYFGDAGIELVLVQLGLDGNRWLEGWYRIWCSLGGFFLQYMGMGGN
ncbi:hypothetical protein BGX38DRAFT_1167816, partial [Terfezia claveryi]